ncbi:RNA dependent RNA polymerase [Arabidopsis halleri partitivirus 1]|uniref:RNA dependent RNA polymerase n=1 Tax=Arabidopsis halleri partitivirus 1 TaxID=1849335 RepID=UPI000848D5FF|nr:RNA dependent RNA polymerase [Arabidopsis halleri partitivirus 1]QIM55484.1 RNA-dependent RNA polymerase [Arabidopsis halleri partitivirus 1]BAV56959.1 RNA dependent RNA polymerase [Arabidopsis halleri partitivirus 1]
MKNTVVLEPLPSLARPIYGDTDPGRNPAYQSTVDHALRRLLTAEEFNIVVNGYRRSPWNEDALTADIEKLNSDYHHVNKDEHYYKAIEHTKKLFTPKEKLRPVHFNDLRHYPWQLSTSIGAPFATSEKWKDYINQKYDGKLKSRDFKDLFKETHGVSLEPYMIDRRLSKRNFYNEMFYINRINIHHIKDGWTTNPAGHDLRYWHTAHARQHLVEAGDEDKVRLVFGAPSTLLMAELMFIWPIQTSLLARGSSSPMLWGYETTTGGWSRLYNWAYSALPRFGAVATLDWSRFDKDARHTVITDIHDLIMRPMFDFNSGYHPTIINPRSNPDPQRLENLWNWMKNAILTTPLLLPDGTRLQFQHSGIYSGYFQTQILDSMYNCVMIFTVLSRMGFDLNSVAIKVQGDDSLILLSHSYTFLQHSFLTTFAHHAAVYFGSTLNVKKSELLPSLEDAEVLRYRNHGMMPYREELQLLAMLRHPERTASLSALMARSIGIAYANCGNYTRVHHICEDIHNYLKGIGVKPDAFGLPGGLRFRKNYLPSYEEIDISHFPTWLETVERLLDPSRPLLTNKHWPTTHFFGIPGES